MKQYSGVRAEKLDLAGENDEEWHGPGVVSVATSTPTAVRVCPLSTAVGVLVRKLKPRIC